MLTLSVTVRLSENDLARLHLIAADLKAKNHRWRDQTHSMTIRELIESYELPSDRIPEQERKTPKRSPRKTRGKISSSVRRSISSSRKTK
jgi:hypothetical protein